MTTDPISEMLTRIRNASFAGHSHVSIPVSKFKIEILKILKNEKFIKDYQVIKDGKKNMVRIHLNYGPKKERAIIGIKRVSTPGCRMYAGAKEIPKVRGGLGVCILSTSHGVLTDREARKRNIGGEIICYVW